MLSPKKEVLALIITFLDIIVISISFRFCLDGKWHQTGLNQRCPYGIAFYNPVPLYCAYENFPNETMKTSFQSDACIGDRYTMAGLDSYDPEKADNLAHNLPDLQVIYYHKGEEDNGGQISLMETPDVVDLSECMGLCGEMAGGDLKEDSGSSSSSSSEEERVLEETDKISIKEQTLRLGDYMYDITFSKDNSLELDYRIVDLFRRSFEVLGRACPEPYIPGEFSNRVLNGFLFLLQDSGTDTLHDITDEEYQDIMDALEYCRSPDQSNRFQLRGTVCTSKASVEEVIFRTDDGRNLVMGYEQNPDNTNYYRYDLFIDAAWKVVDIVHAVCFVHFKPNSNMHHRYQTAMEEMFTPHILKRWQNPTELINTDAWGSWFLVDINSTIRNLYACQRASYLGTPFSMRLDRPFDKQRFK